MTNEEMYKKAPVPKKESEEARNLRLSHNMSVEELASHLRGETVENIISLENGYGDTFWAITYAQIKSFFDRLDKEQQRLW